MRETTVLQHPDGTRSGGPGAASRLALAARILRAAATFLRRWLAAAQASRDEHETCLALGRLDTRTLRDLGLDRSEIRSVARELTTPQATRILARQAGRERS